MNKTWWAPVHRGLVVHKNAKHYLRMGNAIWLFLYLLLHADRKTGTLNRKIETITKDTGIPYWTLYHWLQVLRKHNYIKVKKCQYHLHLKIQKYSKSRLASSGKSGFSDLPPQAARLASPANRLASSGNSFPIKESIKINIKEKDLLKKKKNLGEEKKMTSIRETIQKIRKDLKKKRII